MSRWDREHPFESAMRDASLGVDRYNVPEPRRPQVERNLEDDMRRDFQAALRLGEMLETVVRAAGLDVGDLHDAEPCALCRHPRSDHRFSDPADSPTRSVFSYCQATETVQAFVPLPGLADDTTSTCRCAGFER